MLTFQPPEAESQKPNFQLAPLIDMMFLNLIFFMSLFVYFQLETELSITVPKAEESKEAQRTPGEIVINVMKDGAVVVNQKRLTIEGLTKLLRKTAEWYPGQAVIVRADEKTYHEHIIRVLDSCSKAKIWNISFATSRDKS